MDTEPVRALERAVAAALGADLLSAAQRRRLDPGDHPTTGHCYVAAEAAWHLLGARAAGWSPRVARFTDTDGAPNTHWWLEHPTLGRVDPTAAQFPGGPPYDLGRACGFLTRAPSRRAATLMARVEAQRSSADSADASSAACRAEP